MNNPPAKAEPSDVPTDEEIATKLEPFLRPDKRQQGLQVVATMVQKTHSGPLPSPEDFEHYERILPGLAERIVCMTEREQDHRHTQERRIVTHEYAGRYVGQAGALVMFLAGLAAVVFCAYIGQPIAAAVLGAIGTIVLGYLKYSSMRLSKGEAEQIKPPAKKTPAKRKR